MFLELKRKFIFKHHNKGFSPPAIFYQEKKLEINRTIDLFKEISSITDRPRSGYLVVVVVVGYPTPSKGWEHGGRPWSPRSRATPQGLEAM